MKEFSVLLSQFKKEVFLPFKFLFSFLYLTTGEYTSRLSAWFRYNYSAKYVISFANFSQGLYALLFSYGIKKGDEIIVSPFASYDCLLGIMWSGATPIFVDISSKNFALPPSSARKKITKKTKAILISHTFGIPGYVKELLRIAKSKKLIIIEDCTSVIGVSINKKKVGLFSDAAIFGFGYKKLIASAPGGVIITNKTKIANKLKKTESYSPYPTLASIYYQIINPFRIAISHKILRMNYKIGEFVVTYVEKVVSIINSSLEYFRTPFLTNIKLKRLPNIYARLILLELINNLQDTKKRIDNYYYVRKNLVARHIKIASSFSHYSYIPVISAKRRKSIQSKLTHLYGNSLGELGIMNEEFLSRCGYKKGMCKKAEKIAEKLILIPNTPYMQKNDFDEIINFFASYKTHKHLESSILRYKNVIVQRVLR